MTTNDYRVPIPEDVRDTMNRLGNLIGHQLPPGWGFALMIYQYGDDGALTWISSAEREGMLKMLQEFMRAQAT